MTCTEVEQLTRTVIGCWNRSDWPAYRALTGPGFVLHEPGRVRDIECVLAGWLRIKAAFPDASADIVQIRVRDDLAVCGVVWRATIRPRPSRS